MADERARPRGGPGSEPAAKSTSHSLSPVDDTGEPRLTESEAKRLTATIDLRLKTIADNVEAVLKLIVEAKEGNAHEALGYSWPAYVTTQFGGSLGRLSRATRLPFVELLSQQGMSTRAIAGVVGTSHQTIATDLKGSPVKNLTPARDAVSNVTGIDGKVYPKPEPKKPKKPKKPQRRPLPDQARDAGWELSKAADRIERILADDRMPANREEVCRALRPHLHKTQDTVFAALDQLPRDEAGVTDPYESAIDDLDQAVQRFWRMSPDEWFAGDEHNRLYLDQLRDALDHVADDLCEWWSS